MITRRNFLSGSASALVAAVVAPAAERKSRVVVGAHPWLYAATMPNNDFTPRLPEIFSDFKYAGVDGIELMYMVLKSADTVARIAELSAQHQLPVLGSSFNGPMWDRAQHSLVLDNAGLVIPRLAKLGARTFGISVGPLRGVPPKTRKTPEQLDAQAECLQKVLTLCREHGLLPNLHNHTYEVENDLHDLKGTLARVPDVKLGPDLNWLMMAGVNPVEFIQRYGERIVFLHLRDQRRDLQRVEAMGEGHGDFAAIGQALHAVGFSGHAVIELAHEKDFVPTRPFRESYRISREFVRRTLGY